jgi:dolichol-phosphate mannosyltransferase
MSASSCRVSIVCPAYQEEEVLPRFHAELLSVLATLSPDYEFEILYVDDGSTDATLDVLRSFATDRRVRYLSLSRNFGYQAALTAGLESASGDVIVSLDSDLQHPPALIPTLLQKWREGHDVVLTMREDDKRDSWLRRLAAHGFAWLMRRVSESKVQAPACDYRLLSRKAVDGLLRMRETHRYLRGLVSWVGYRTAMVPFRVAPRGGGSSKYNLRSLTGLSIDALLSFSKAPLRLSLTAGLVVMALGLVAAIYGIAAALVGWAVPAATILLLISMHLIGGAILCSLGLLGEYVGRVYEQVKGRPLYLVKEVSPSLEAVRMEPPAARERLPRDKGAAA